MDRVNFDSELIEEVKTKPVLYDTNNPRYKDVELKQKIWWDICQKIMDAKDETTAVHALKLRWKNLRHGYVKERKLELAQTNGVKKKPKKPWRFKTQLEFLAPFVNLRHLSAVTETETVSPQQYVNTVSPQQNADTGSPQQNADTEVDNPLQAVSQSTPETVSEMGSSFELNMFNQRIPQSSDQRFIEIDSFFHYIASTVKGLNQNSQLSLEKEITSLVLSYKLKELEDEDRELNPDKQRTIRKRIPSHRTKFRMWTDPFSDTSWDFSEEITDSKTDP